MKVKRHNIYIVNGYQFEEPFIDSDECEDGDWVKYEDYKRDTENYAEMARKICEKYKYRLCRICNDFDCCYNLNDANEENKLDCCKEMIKRPS